MNEASDRLVNIRRPDRSVGMSDADRAVLIEEAEAFLAALNETLSRIAAEREK